MVRYFGAARFRMSEEERILFADMFTNVVKMKTSGDRCLGYFLHFASYSVNPLCKVVKAVPSLF
jgi:hypothetical protein